MTRLETTVSEVFHYSDRLRTCYTQLTGEAAQVQSDVRDMRMRVQEAENSVTNQVYQAQRLRDDAAARRSHYENMTREAEYAVRRAQDQVQYVLNNPVPVTEYDNEGNAHTHYEVDQAALAAAESALRSAEAEYQYYYGKYREAEALEQEASAVVTRFEAMQNAIVKVGQAIETEQHRIDTYRHKIDAEANYNLNSVQRVKDKLTDYLNCADFSTP